MRLGVRHAVVGVAVVGGLVSALNLTGEAPLALQGAPGRVLLDTIATISAALVSLLMLGRFRQRFGLRDLVLCEGLAVLALGNLVFTVLPVVVNGTSDGATSVAPVVAGLFAGATVAAAGFIPAEQRLRPGNSARLTALVSGGVLAQLAVASGVGRVVAMLPASAIGSIETFGTTPDQVVSAAQLLAAALFLLAGFALARHAGDWLSATFAVGAVLAALSRLNFAFADSPGAERVVTANVFRLGFYAVLLFGAAQEIRAYWRRASEAAVLEERRRIARDLHDGLAQELAYVVTRSRQMDSAGGRIVAAAAERALDESRRAIAALTRPLDEPFDVALSQTAEEVAGRLGARVQFDIEKQIRLDSDRREALLRIAREAVTNAARHSGAERILVRLRNHDGVTLQVLDDGLGFDADDRRHLSGRFGLISMRERAHAAGGRLDVRSSPATGTVVEVWVP